MAKTKKKQAESAPSDRGATLVEWTFPEHDEHERGRRWYIISSLLIALLLVYAIYDQNYLLAIIVGLSIFIFIFTEMRGPEIQRFAITEDGIEVGSAFYQFEAIRNFFLIYQPPEVKMLYFDPKSIFRPMVGVPLFDQNPNEIREILIQFVPEDLDRETEPMGDFLGRLFKL